MEILQNLAKQFTLHSAEAYSEYFQTSEAVVWRCAVEKVFLEISQSFANLVKLQA